MTVGEFCNYYPAHLGEATLDAIEGLDLIELLRASPSPSHWHLADKIEAAE